MTHTPEQTLVSLDAALIVISQIFSTFCRRNKTLSCEFQAMTCCDVISFLVPRTRKFHKGVSFARRECGIHHTHLRDGSQRVLAPRRGLRLSSHVTSRCENSFSFLLKRDERCSRNGITIEKNISNNTLHGIYLSLSFDFTVGS